MRFRLWEFFEEKDCHTLSSRRLRELAVTTVVVGAWAWIAVKAGAPNGNMIDFPPVAAGLLTALWTVGVGKEFMDRMKSKVEPEPPAVNSEVKPV